MEINIYKGNIPCAALRLYSPCYSAVACLDVDSCVCYITCHYIVGKVRLQDVEIRINSDLKQRPKEKRSI